MDSVKLELLRKLKANNASLNNTYGPLLRAYEELFETVVYLKLKSVKHASDKHNGPNSANDSSIPSTNVIATLEKKLSELQAELTDLYKRRSENAQNLIDANRKIEVKDGELTILRRKLEEAEGKVSCLTKTNGALKDQLITLEETNNCLRDEYLVMQTSHNLLETKLKDSLEENQKICSKYLEMKLKEADIMNMENTWQQKIREVNLRSQLAEATKEHVNAPAGVATESLPQVLRKNSEAAEQILRHKSAPISRQVIASVPNRCEYRFEAHDGEVNAVKWSPTGKYLASGGADRRIKLWTFDEEKPVCSSKLDGCNLAVTCLDFDPDEAYVACGSNDFAVRLWTLATQRSLVVFSGHSNKVYATRFAGSTGRLVSGSHDRTVKVWDMRTRCCSKTFFAGSICYDLVTCQAGPSASIISGHHDRKLRFWDTRSDKNVSEVLFAGRIASLDLSKDGNYLLCCTRDEQLHNYDLRANRILKSYSDEHFKTGLDYTQCCFSPDRQFCAAGSLDGSIFVWNVETGSLETCLDKKHETTVVAVHWHPNGQILASCDRHKILCVWS